MAEELEIREALDAIRKKKHGDKALEILDVITYLATENIHVDMLSSLVDDEKQLKSCIQLLHQYSIVYYDRDKTVFNIHKAVKKLMLTIQEKENRKLQILKKVTQILHPDKYEATQNRVDHYSSVWGYLKPYPQLIELYSEVPQFISIDMGKMTRYSEAINFAIESWDLLCDTVGERHRNAVTLRSLIPKLYAEDGRHEEALTLLFAAMLELDADSSDPEEIGDTIFFMTSELCKVKRYEDALDIYQQIIFKDREVIESNSPRTLLYWCHYAEILGNIGRYVESTEIFRKVLKRGKQMKDFENSDVVAAKDGLANVLVKQSKYSEALELYREVCRSRIMTFGKDHPKTMEVVQKAFVAYKQAGGKSDEVLVFDDLCVDSTHELKAKNNVKLEPICSAAKRGNLNKVKTLVKSGVDINKQDGSRKTPLHYAAAHNHMSVVKFLLQKGAIYNHKDKDGKTPSQITEYGKIKSLLDSVEILIKDVKEGNCEKASERIAEEKVILNAKDDDGCNSLHWAAHNGHKDIVRLLLKIGADATQVTNKGNTPLHIATSKGHQEIVEVLLQHPELPDELNTFINAQTFRGGVTAIHVAAKNGFSDIVKCLLKYGAIYNVRNKEGKTPLELSRDHDVVNLLKLVDKLFEDAKNGNLEIVGRLQAAKPDEFIALTSARNHLSNTILQVTVANQHENIASKLSKMCEAPNQTTPGSSSRWTIDEIKKFKKAAEVLMRFSIKRLRALCSVSTPYLPGKNPHPFVTLMEGSYYLSDVCHFVEVYKTVARGSIEDENVQRVNDTLEELEFDPNHIASENKDIKQFDDMLADPEFKPIESTNDEDDDGEEVQEWFSFNGQGKKYHKMLHSESKKNLRSFLELVDDKIETPVTDFLESMEQRLQYVDPEKFFLAIQNNDHLDVGFRIKEGADINSKNTDGRTPLHYAVNNGNLAIVNILLENGADATQATVKGNTPLHTATSKGLEDIIKVLLENVGYDKLNDFVNARTTVGGTTALHVAAKNGSMEIVKILLTNGAFYNVKNSEGKTPLDLTKDRDIRNLLKLTSELYRNGAEGDNCKIITQLRESEPGISDALANVRDDKGNNLLEVTMRNMRQKDGRRLTELSKASNKCKLDELTNLKEVVELHMRWCKLYLHYLRSVSKSRDSDDNRCRSTTLRNGTYYLGTALAIAGICDRNQLHGSDCEDLQAVHDTVEALEFDPNHMTLNYNYVDDQIFDAEEESKRYYKLLHSESMKDVRDFIEIIERDIESPMQKFVESIEAKIQSLQPENLFAAIGDNDLSEVEYRVNQGVDVNSKNIDGQTPLHFAVGNGHLSIVGFLLGRGADATKTTSYGNTSLHIAICEGQKDIVNVLLQHVSRDKLNNFINAKSFKDNTPLHLSSKNGCLETVKSLLKHGATYNALNKEGNTPLDLTQNRDIANLLKLTGELFQYSKNGDDEVIDKLQELQPDEFVAVTNARDSRGATLLQVAKTNNREYISSRLLEMLESPYQIRSSSSHEWTFDQIERLKKAAECYIKSSESYLRILRNTSQSNRSEKNSFPWATLKAGSHYLQNAHNLVEEYKICVHGSISDRNIRAANDTLVELEFDPKHITLGYTDEAYHGKVECFVSRGQGTKYYELLHSDSKKDVRYFVELVGPRIDNNIKRFLESMKQKFRSFLSKLLFEAIDNNDHPEVKNCIKEEGVIDLRDQQGRTPLTYAADNKNLGIINILLKNGANVTLVDDRGRTVLHIASSEGQIRILETVLDHVDHEQINDFINARTTGPGEMKGATALHGAAVNGMFEIVKFLLTHGAIYNLETADGKTPLDCATEENTSNLLKLVHTIFEGAKTGKTKIINKLKAAKLYEFTAVTNTRNEQGQSLVQVARLNKHDPLVGKLETIIKSRSVTTTGH